MESQVAVTVTSFGQGRGRVQLRLPAGSATVGEAARLAGVDLQGRRVAVNGQLADAGTTVAEGDQVSVVPRIVGG